MLGIRLNAFTPLITDINTSLFSFHVFVSVTLLCIEITVALMAVVVLVSTGTSTRDSRASGDVRPEKNPAKARPENRGKLPSRLVRQHH